MRANEVAGSEEAGIHAEATHFPHSVTGCAPGAREGEYARLENEMTVCKICEGVGLVRGMDAAGNWVSRECQCQESEREQRRIQAAQIPARYRDCTLDTFEIYHEADRSLAEALLTARRFVEEYPAGTAGKGLLFTGSMGVGKTHLAVGVLQRLVRERGAKGFFCDYRELLKSIQNSYNPEVRTTELELLKPVFAAEVLVLDDLGAQKPNEWVWDTVALILNTRYNDRQTTIITTNYADLPAGGGGVERHGACSSRGNAWRPDRGSHAVEAGGDVHPGKGVRKRLPANGDQAGAVWVREAASSF